MVLKVADFGLSIDLTEESAVTRAGEAHKGWLEVEHWLLPVMPCLWIMIWRALPWLVLVLAESATKSR